MALRKFQLLSCDIALGGDILNVVARGEHNPVTYPELILLQFTHGGEQSVTNIWDVGYVEREDASERQRLTLAYGGEKVKEVFANAGAGQGLPNGDNRYAQKPRVVVAPPVAEPAPVLRNATEIEPAAVEPVTYGDAAPLTAYAPAEPEPEPEAIDTAPVRASRRPTPVGAA